MNAEPVIAGCTKCGQQFYLPVDKAGVPQWVHRCPKTTDERIEELTAEVSKLTQLVTQLKDGAEMSTVEPRTRE